MKMKDNRLVLCLFLFAGAALHSHPSYANNGAVAIAVPMEGITIDGDLSDWPADMRRYPIMLPEFGVRPRDTEDFQGFFRIGYNRLENILYFAVEIHDESTVIDPTAGAEWNTQDGCEVYVNVEQKEKDASVVQYVIFGDTPRAGPYEVKVSREEKAHWYEWQIDIGEMSKGPVHLNPEMTIGVDVVVCDKDEDGSFSWMAWGRGAFKGSYADRLGDVILVEEDAELGVIQGTVKREEVEEGIAHAKVRFQSLTSERKLMVKTDRMGAYAIELPAGWYRVSAAELGRGARAHITAEVREGSEEEIALVVQTSRGQVVPAGPGKGHWQTFGIPDGLSSPIVLAIVEDRKGDLWFGTFGGGVSHYDGETFTTFNTEDGLVDNAVRSIVEDREGDLWFGTDGGLSRYDGETFTNYTTEDGLSDNNIFSIAEDREGDLWFGTFGGGVSRYDGEIFTNYTTENGLADDRVLSIVEDRGGHLWFGTNGGGVSRYDGEMFTNYTTKDGLADNNIFSIVEDREGDLWFGTFGEGVSRYDGETFTTYTTEEGLAHNWIPSILADREGGLWFGTQGGGVSHYDGQTFTTYTTEEGLGHNVVLSIAKDREGHLWFGTDGGLSRYDGETFTAYTIENGLVSNVVLSIVEDREGHLWFGTNGGGVSRYDGVTFTNYTTEDGLAHKRVQSILADRQGYLWFGTEEGGVSRYDGATFTNYTTEDGLTSNGVWAIVEDREGHLWFGTYGGGVSRYDGETFTNYTTEDGLADNVVLSLLEDLEGHLWFGTFGGGVSRYDGETFTNYTTEDGLVDKRVQSILEDREGHLWFGTFGGGVSRYDGEAFTNYTTEDGLAYNDVGAILEDLEGHLWFGTFGGGVSRYDRFVFQNLLSRDGLVYDMIHEIYQDRKGSIWIGTEKGITRYRPRHTPPLIHLTRIVADRHYGAVEEIRLPSSQKFLMIEFQGLSFKTRPGAMVFLYRLKGYEEEWQQTREPRVEYTDLPIGDYVFQVKAVDRDLDYSEVPAEVRIIMHLPYGQIALVGGLGIALLGLVLTSGYAVKRRQDQRRAERALMQELEEELQTAHDMQMGLMPAESPRISGFDISGRCIPANHVGGDFFQYFPISDNRLAISLADVTGHAMEAAVPVMMFSGILDNQMEAGDSLEDLFAKLNRSLHRNLNSRTFVCFTMVELDTSTRQFRISNGGCPYPYHFQASTSEVAELQVDAYPLGVRAESTYPVIEAQLEPEDRVVFCSDGIIEAENSSGEIFGFDRTAETIRKGCQEGLSASALLDRIIGEVKAFAGETPQGDDQTVVILRVES